MPTLPGPNGPISFTRDALGYPSLRVKDQFEGAFALGYLHALDRQGQVELMVLAGRGELLSVLGDVPVARIVDRVARLLNWAGDLEAQCSRLDPETQAYLGAYSDGFNRGTTAQMVSVAWHEIGLPHDASPKLRDLWAHKDLPVTVPRSATFSASVQPHDVVMLRVAP